MELRLRPGPGILKELERYLEVQPWGQWGRMRSPAPAWTTWSREFGQDDVKDDHLSLSDSGILGVVMPSVKKPKVN